MVVFILLLIVEEQFGAGGGFISEEVAAALLLLCLPLTGVLTVKGILPGTATKVKEESGLKYVCNCKATTREEKEPRISENWMFSKRARLKVFEDHIKCGSWTINKDDIEALHCYHITKMGMRSRVQQITTPQENYQFGFDPWKDPLPHLGLEYTESEAKLTYSPFSILLRLALLAAFLYWLGSKYL